MKNRIHNIIDELENDKILSKTIFKYYKIDKTLYSLIENNEIWFSNPYKFNDPFDCNLTIDANNSPEQIKNYFKLANWQKYKNIDIDIKNLIDSDFKDKEAFKRKLNSISGKIIDNLGLACFTPKKDNLLMWAHYTKEHRGVVLEFDYSKDLDFFKPLKKMNYVKKYPIYNYYDERKKIVEQLILNKSIHWKYESEIRLLKHKVGLFKFNCKSLKAIYFGIKTSTEEIETIKSYIDKNVTKYKNLKLYKGKIDEKDYKIIFEEIEL